MATYGQLIVCDVEWVGALMMMWYRAGAIPSIIISHGSHPAKALWWGTSRPYSRFPSAEPEPRYLKSSVLSAAPEPRYLKSLYSGIRRSVPPGGIVF